MCKEKEVFDNAMKCIHNLYFQKEYEATKKKIDAARF